MPVQRPSAPRRERRGAPRTAAAAATAAFGVYAVGSGIVSRLQPPGYDPTQESVTVLTATGTPYRWLIVTTLVLVGLLITLTAATLPTRARAERAVLGVAGLATVAVALLPRSSATSISVPAAVCGVLALIALAIWPAAAAGPPVRGKGPWRLAMLLLAGVAGLAIAAMGSLSPGTYERVLSLVLLAHLALAAFRCWWAAGHRIGSRPVQLAASAVVLSIGCLVGGVLATVIAPVTVATANYQAALSLSPDLGQVGRVVLPTVLGDVEAQFSGPAPGVRANLQLRAGITTALGAANSSLESLQPSPAELDRVVTAALTGLGIRFGQGALAVALAAVVLRALILRRRPGPRTGIAALIAMVLALAATGASIAGTYRGATPKQLSATGLLGAIQQNSTLFDDVAERSAQVAPYLRSVVAVSAALRERYQPPPIDSERVLRILLISDVHAGDQYPLIASMIESEGIDLVIDSGDLLNFGTVAEGEISGVFAGIADLPVPYVFVRGNHDAMGPTDDAVLRRLDGIPNVILLQPDSQRYQELTIAGVRIGGFNDPRWFGDDGKQSAQKQQPAKAQWLASFAGQEVPDIVVSHEPWAVQGIAGAGVLINGHMHTAFREGNRIQVGTFTGGGPLTHFISGEGSEELVGQPSAFDILDIGPTCRVTALTRYRFAHVVEGRPTFDDVALLNGAVIDTRPVDPDRTCAADLPPNVTSVPAVSPPG